MTASAALLGCVLAASALRAAGAGTVARPDAAAMIAGPIHGLGVPITVDPIAFELEGRAVQAAAAADALPPAPPLEAGAQAADPQPSLDRLFDEGGGGQSGKEELPPLVSVPYLGWVAKTRVLSPARWAYMGPKMGGRSYLANLRDLARLMIDPPRLRGAQAQTIDLGTTLFGRKLDSPILTAPTGQHQMIHARGELASAAGTGRGGGLFVKSGASNFSTEEIAAAAEGPLGFQIYLNKDWTINRDLARRAKEAGYLFIVLTVDGLGRSDSDGFLALGSPIPPGLTFGDFDPARGGRGNYRDQRPPRLEDIAELRDWSGLPVIVKGLARPEDIAASLAAGAAGIWVTNHGGRQMDGGASSAMLLPRAVAAVEDYARRNALAERPKIVFDSGVRRGDDLFKALALGADLVAVGRPPLWGLAAGGSLGVEAVYRILIAELKAVMMLSGAGKLSDIARDHVIVPADWTTPR